MSEQLDAAYWDKRYAEQQTQWDIGYSSTPLVDYFEQLPGKNMSILIPGCGNAYEAEYLLRNGFGHITLVDISPVITSTLKERFKEFDGKQLTVVTGDFFDLIGQFDLIIEQTFFCALQPYLRKRYVEKMYQLLKPGGKLVGVLFNRDFVGGPPFGGTKEEYELLLKSKLNLVKMEPCYNSIPPRKGAEVFFIAEKEKTAQ